MRLKATVTEGAPDELIEVLGSKSLAIQFLSSVVMGVFGIKDAANRPAEHCVLKPDLMIRVSETLGVELRLAGVTRGDHEEAIFYTALGELADILQGFVEEVLEDASQALCVELVCVIELDSKILVSTNPQHHSNILKSKPIFVSSSGFSGV